MRSIILMGCFYLICIAGYTQGNGRIGSSTALRWSMNSSIEIMEGDLTQHYGSTDSLSYKRANTAITPVNNPRTTVISSVQARCDNNSMLVNWVAQQQQGADRYELEQSDDGGANWRKIGGVLATQAQTAQSSYGFNYYKNTASSLFRIAAISVNGERLFSSIFQSPCNANSFLSVTPNPVQSTTTVRIGSPNNTKAKLLLMNNTGIVVQTRDVTLLRGTNNVSLNMSNLQTGYYTLAIQWLGGKQDVLDLIKR